MVNKSVRNIEVRGARVHNLKNIDVDIPLNRIVGIAGVSGSGKSSLALGVLYAEGSRRYLEAMSTYTRRRMTQAPKADVDEILYIPASIALHQRPGVPGIRSTFGTGTELLNSLRLMFSRLASHRCPKCGHYHAPSLDVAAERELICDNCSTSFYGPSAEDLSFNSTGACERCGGTGTVMTVDRSTLVPDETLTIDEGAVAPWKTLMWSLMTNVCRAMGVRTNVPFNQLTPKEREIVFDGPAEKKHILYKGKNSEQAVELDFTFYNAVYTVENALAKVKDDKGMKRVARFLHQGLCPACRGTRLSDKARAPRLRGISLDVACEMTLAESVEWVHEVPGRFPTTCARWPGASVTPICRPHAVCSTSDSVISRSTAPRRRSRPASGSACSLPALSETARQACSMCSTSRRIGLHPANIIGLVGVMNDLVADGNSVVLVDHDTQILGVADHIIEMGPGAGEDGGRIVAQGSVAAIEADPESKIGPFLAGKAGGRLRPEIPAEDIFDDGCIHISTDAIHTVRPLEVDIPKGRLTVVTGVSGSGKTTLILESLVAGLQAQLDGRALPAHVRRVEAEGIKHVKLIDSTPIGANVRSTVATYANIHDELRKIYAATADARMYGYKASDFSYNTGNLRCPVCDGTGSVSLDIQFLPDVDIPCPECHGTRYSRDCSLIHSVNRHGESFTLPELMETNVCRAVDLCADHRTVKSRLKTLRDLGLGYLTLGEATPSLSGGEAQRLKLSAEMGKAQSDSVFVFDEPTIGLHPLDVMTLLGVLQHLVEAGATVIVIEHDLDVIRNADYIIDMGPGGGTKGGRVVAAGTPAAIAASPDSVTGRFIR